MIEVALARYTVDKAERADRAAAAIQLAGFDLDVLLRPFDNEPSIEFVVLTVKLPEAGFMVKLREVHNIRIEAEGN